MVRSTVGPRIFGDSFAVKQEPETKARELEASGSAVKGVYYDKRSRKWHVGVWGSLKCIFGGKFVVMEEAEAKAREMTNKFTRRPSTKAKQ